MFQFPGFTPRKRGPRPSVGWVSPFGNPRIKQLFAPPRGLSQLITSFIVFESQGIHHTPLFTFFNNNIYKLKNQLLFQHVKELFPLIWDSKNTRNRTVFFPKKISDCSTNELIFKIQYIKNENIVKSVENKGVEPLTPCVQGRCSSQLS
jgi:hypothetical protein